MNIVEKTIAACNAIGFKFDKVGINCVYLENGQMFSPALYSNDALKLLVHARTLPAVDCIKLNLYGTHLTITATIVGFAFDVALSSAVFGDNVADTIRQAIIDACIELGEKWHVAN